MVDFRFGGPGGTETVGMGPSEFNASLKIVWVDEEKVKGRLIFGASCVGLWTGRG